MSSSKVLLMVILTIHLCHSYQIDNGIVNTPVVECGADTITLNVYTKKPFVGRIFVKGESHRPECIREFFHGNLDEKPTMEVKFSTCGMRRERKLSPAPGSIHESMTVVVSFHQLLITHLDKAYHILCSYSRLSESFATVTQYLNVSMLPTETLRGEEAAVGLPDCSYDIRRNTMDGPLVRYAEVGDTLVHIWNCNDGKFAFLVKSCTVNDGNNKYQIVDTRGCSVDPVVMPEINYTQPNSGEPKQAWVEARAFKFAETVALRFSCVIQLCPSATECQLAIPPVCNGGEFTEVHNETQIYADRQRRSIELINPEWDDTAMFTGNETDVSPLPISVLDAGTFEFGYENNYVREKRPQLAPVEPQLDQPDQLDPSEKASQHQRDLFYPIMTSAGVVPRGMRLPEDNICLSKLAFILLLIVAFTVLVFTVAFCTVFYLRMLKKSSSARFDWH